MDYAFLDTLRHTHPAWRLLLADHAPLIASVLFKSFIEPNVRTLSQLELESVLDDHLHALRSELGDGAFPRAARQYLMIGRPTSEAGFGSTTRLAAMSRIST